MKKWIAAMLALLTLPLCAHAGEWQAVYTEHTIAAVYTGQPSEIVTARLCGTDGTLIDIRQGRTDEMGAYAYQFTFDEEKRDTYTLRLVTETEMFEESFAYEGAAGNEFLQFSIDSVPGVIDGNRIAVHLPAADSVKRLCPVFFVSDYATVTVADAEQTSGVSEQDFSAPVVYTVTSGGGDSRQYTVSVTGKRTEKPSKNTGGGGGGSGGKDAPVNLSVPAAALPVQSNPQPPKEIPPELPFADVAASHWAHGYIRMLYQAGIVADAAQFEPERAISRAEFVKLLVLALSLYDETAQCDFSDIADAPWSEPYIASAAKAGLVNGIGDGLFGVGQPISRQDMAVICARSLQLEGGQPTFADRAEIAGYAKDSVGAMQQAGIMTGYENHFLPQSHASRAETAKIISGILTGKRGEAHE